MRGKQSSKHNTVNACPTDAIIFTEVLKKSVKWQTLLFLALSLGSFLHRYKMKMLEFSKVPKTTTYEAITAQKHFFQMSLEKLISGGIHVHE